jgi:hypothetical protein
VAAVRTHLPYGKVLQITAPISPGSSGGPVVNLHGEVIGVICYTYTTGQNLNFSIAAQAVPKLKVTRGDTVQSWNQTAIFTTSDHPAATNLQAFYSALNQDNYTYAWSLLDKASQEALVKEVAYDTHDSEDAARSLLTSMDGEKYWRSIKTGFGDSLGSATFTLRDVEEDTAVLNVHVGQRDPYPFVMKKEDEQWKVGLSETIAAATKK